MMIKNYVFIISIFFVNFILSSSSSNKKRKYENFDVKNGDVMALYVSAYKKHVDNDFSIETKPSFLIPWDDYVRTASRIKFPPFESNKWNIKKINEIFNQIQTSVIKIGKPRDVFIST